MSERAEFPDVLPGLILIVEAGVDDVGAFITVGTRTPGVKNMEVVIGGCGFDINQDTPLTQHLGLRYLIGDGGDALSVLYQGKYGWTTRNPDKSSDEALGWSDEDMPEEAE